MTFLDAAIIYLACGSPACAYYFLQDPRRASAVPASLLVLLTWPVFVLKLLVDRRPGLSGTYSSNNAGPDSDYFDAVRSELEEYITEPQNRLFEFRETFDRYTGLGLALGREDSGRTHELFIAAGHKNAEQATICLKRRNRSRLLAHLTRAGDDLVQLLEPHIAEQPQLASLAAGVAEKLGDRTTRFRILAAAATPGEAPDERWGNEVWVPQTTERDTVTPM